MKFDRITDDPERMNRQPCIRQRFIKLLAAYPDRAKLFQEYTDLQEEDIQQALLYFSINATV